MPEGNLSFIYAQLVEFLIKLNSVKIDLSDIPFYKFDYDEGIFKQIRPYYKGSEDDFNKKTSKVKNLAKDISANTNCYKGIVHYNLHFDNIYYEEQTTSFKFDNPNEKGIIVGDIRADYALLRLNAAQRVCQIKDRLFKIKNGGIFWLSDAPKNFLDDILNQKGFNLAQIKALEFFAAHLLTVYFDDEQKTALYIMLAQMLDEF